MATLKEIKAIAERLTLSLASKEINFLHKHQDQDPGDLFDAFESWFNQTPADEKLAGLVAVLIEIQSGNEDAPESEIQVGDEDPELAVSESDVEEVQPLPTTEPDSDAEIPDLEAEPKVSDDTPSDDSGLEAPDDDTASLEDQDSESSLLTAETDDLPSEDMPEETGIDSPSLNDSEFPVDADQVDEAEQSNSPEPEPEPEPVVVKPFSPWWSSDEPTTEGPNQSSSAGKDRPDVSSFLDVTRRSDSDRVEELDITLLETSEIEMSWESAGASATYVICGDLDHYPFEVTVDNAIEVTQLNEASYWGPLRFFTIFVFPSPGSKGAAWAKGRYVPEIEWLSAEVVDGKVALSWSEPEADVELRIAKSLPDQELSETPTANFWLPVNGSTGNFADERVELGRRYHYRAYLEWVSANGAVLSTKGIETPVDVVIEFPRVLSFEAELDAEVSGKVTCSIEGVHQAEYVQVFEVDGLPSQELLAAIESHRQLPVDQLTTLAVKSWLGKPHIGDAVENKGGLRVSSLMSNANKTSKTFVLVLKLGSVAQVTALNSIQRVGEIHTATLIERFDYQLVRLDDPMGAQSLDIWIVAASVPFEHIAHTQPNRRVLIQEEYLRYGGILFAHNVPNKPQIRTLAPDPQTIYIRGASTFEGQTEFGPVVQVNYPGRLVVSYMTEPIPQEEQTQATTPKPKRKWRLFSRKPKAKPVAPVPEKATLPTGENSAEVQSRPTNKRIDALGDKLLGQSAVENAKDERVEGLLKRLLRALTPKRRPKKKARPTEGPRLLVMVDGAESMSQLQSVSALHFASKDFPLDEHDSTVSKSPLEINLAQNRGRYMPYKTGQAASGEPQFLRLEPRLQHRFQLQSEMPGDTLNGVRCFSVDGSIDQEKRRQNPTRPAELNLSVTVVGPSGSGKSTFLASLTHYLQHQYELLVRAELVEASQSENSLRNVANELAREGKLPRQGKPVTGSADSPTSTLRFVSRSPVEFREIHLVDTSGIDFANPESMELASEFLLGADLLVVTIDPTLNPTVAELSSGLVSKSTARSEADEPFWLVETLAEFLSANAAARNPKQKIAICVTKFDAVEVANEIYGTSLTGTIRSGMAMSRDPHLLWSGKYLESFGELQNQEVKSLLGRISGYGPFLKLVEDSFDPKQVRFFGVSALGRSNFSSTLGGGGLTPTRISDPLRWIANELSVNYQLPSEEATPKQTNAG